MAMNSQKLEELAELEHEQWMAWTKGLAKRMGEINTLNPDCYEAFLNSLVERWKKNWKPYAELPEVVKEQDRLWAKKALELAG